MKIVRQIATAAWVVFTLVTCATNAALAQRSDARSDLAAGIDRVVTPFVSARDFMGVLAVQRDGADALVLSYGMASIELGVPHRESDVFLIGSMSKQFTAVGILLLEQEGLLSTDDSIGRHLPEFNRHESITIEQLLTHTSGVVDVFSLRRFGETNGRGGSFSDIVRDLMSTELTHRPGSAYAYSSGGYSLLAAIIEQVSGMSYGDYLASRVFEPLGMSSTRHDRPGPVEANRVPGYDPWGRDELTSVVPPAPAYTKGSGSLWSSARDLLIWNSALHGGRLLTAESYAKLTRDYGHAYGYGVSVFERFGRDVIGHDGRVAGYASDMARYVRDSTTVVVLSNVQSVARDEIRRSVAAIVFGEPTADYQARVFADRPLNPLAELTGVYSFGPGFDVTVSISGGRVLARANEGSDSGLVPLADGSWFSRVLYTTVRFERDDSGRVERLIWGSGDRASVGTRVR